MSTHNIPFLNINKKIILNYLKTELWDLFQGIQERVRNSRGKRAISVRAIEVLLYVVLFTFRQTLSFIDTGIKSWES